MISGECRVDTLPFGDSPNSPAGRRLAIDGLRLRLDLRIVPAAAGAGGGSTAAEAVWRIENARLATLPFGVPASYRTVAVASGLGAVVVALGVWFAGAPSTATGPVDPSFARTPAGGAPSAPPASVPAGAGPSAAGGPSVAVSSPARGVSAGIPSPAAPSAGVPRVAPRIAAVPAGAAASAATAAVPPGAAREGDAGAPPHQALPARPLQQPSSLPHAGHPSAARRRSPAPPARAAGPATHSAPAAEASPRSSDSTRDDRLDLFGDPK